MAVPKQRTSRSKQRMRRSHHKASCLSFTLCSNCQTYKLTHVICRKCGFYKGTQRIVIKKKK